MVAKYHKTGRKEKINGKLRTIYIKDKSDKEYIRYGSSRYVAIRKSRKQKGGEEPDYTEVNMSEVIASVAVFDFADKTVFYPYTEAFKDKENFKNIMTYNDDFRGIPDKSETDAKIHLKFKNALAIKAMKDNQLLNDTSDYLKGNTGFMVQQVVSFCFNCSYKKQKETNTTKQYILFTLYMTEDPSITSTPILDHYKKIQKANVSGQNMKNNVEEALSAIKDVLKQNMGFFLNNAISAAPGTGSVPAQGQAPAQSATPLLQSASPAAQGQEQQSMKLFLPPIQEKKKIPAQSELSQEQGSVQRNNSPLPIRRSKFLLTGAETPEEKEIFMRDLATVKQERKNKE
jgi:hypothetical protein